MDVSTRRASLELQHSQQSAQLEKEIQQSPPVVIVSVVRSLEALRGLVYQQKKRKLRIHYPFKSFDALGVKPGDAGTKEELFYEDLYDTPKFDLLPTHWLWKRDDEWILKIDKDSEPGTSVFEEKRGKDAIQAIRIRLGDDWQEKVETLVTLKTTRFYVSNSHWVDFTSWARWKIGYYAVQTFAVDSGEADIPIRSDFFPIPSKGMACLFHILPTNFKSFFCSRLKIPEKEEEEFMTFVKKSSIFVHEEPLYGPQIGFHSSEESGDESFEESDESCEED